MTPRSASTWRSRYALAEDIDFLNHGSYGAPARVVLEAQDELRRRLEREPISFFQREYPARLAESRHALADFVGANPADLVFVPNATTGVNTVLQSLEFEAGDELVVTNHEYNASRCAMDRRAGQRGATVRVVEIPLPVEGPEAIAARILDAVSPRTRLVMLDHITSPTGLIMPVERIIRELDRRGIESLVDGAHAPGMLPLDLRSLGATYYAGNCHKWLGTPKGAGFLVVREDRHAVIEPTVVSHGWNAEDPAHSRFHRLFDWSGTHDPTAVLAIPEAIRFGREVLEGGWPALRERNRDLVLEGRRLLSEALGTAPIAPAECIGSLASIPIPATTDPPDRTLHGMDRLQQRLYDEDRIVVPIVPWPRHPHRLIRVSAQLYNDVTQYERLARILVRRLGGTDHHDGD